jgi:hypothetical protein
MSVPRYGTTSPYKRGLTPNYQKIIILNTLPNHRLIVQVFIILIKSPKTLWEKYEEYDRICC